MGGVGRRDQIVSADAGEPLPTRGSTTPGDTQRLVRATMLAAGGYWRPLAAVARLLEELGELLELLQRPDSSRPELGSELADLWIITTALADQFLAPVAEPPAGGQGGAETETPRGADLVIAAGAIARVVNHYDGPKKPRAGAEMPSLAHAVSAFHDSLGGLSSSLGIDLGEAVREKIATIHRRGDMTRFALAEFDPSTAEVLARYRDAEPTGGTRAPGLRRLWGAPDRVDEADVELHAAAIAPSLWAFAKAAPAEGLEGYVIAGPVLSSPVARQEWADRLLGALAAIDPGAVAGSPGASTREASFGGMRLLVELPEPHPAAGARRDAPGETFLVLVARTPP